MLLVLLQVWKKYLCFQELFLYGNNFPIEKCYNGAQSKYLFLILHVVQCWDVATIDVKTDLGWFALIFFPHRCFFFNVVFLNFME